MTTYADDEDDNDHNDRCNDDNCNDNSNYDGVKGTRKTWRWVTYNNMEPTQLNQQNEVAGVIGKGDCGLSRTIIRAKPVQWTVTQ